ncbi:MAG: DUF2975 domain-containing protein [Clostridiales bacterium]|jgi:hypothetical protein|nr:DUF2975 domain-containing protein [Clostridiales bacterium]
MQESIFSRILRIALYAIFVVGLAGAATLPFMLDFYVRLIWGFNALGAAYWDFILPFLMVVAAPALWIVLEMIWMMNSIPKGPFVMRNVRALYRIGVLLIALAAAFIFKCFFFLTVLTLFCVFFFVLSGLFAFTLAALIRQSVVFREENDLTI